MLDNYAKPEYNHKRAENGALNLTKLILECPKQDFIVRIYDEESNGYVYQIPLKELDNTKSMIQAKFSPNEEHYSVRVVSCEDDFKLLKQIYIALEA